MLLTCNQLLELKNIQLQPLQADQPMTLNQRITITPIEVPHRGEYSETVAFIIQGPHQRVLFLPDIDRWEDWDRAIEDVIKACDLVFLDGTFLAASKLRGRDMSTIPHPTIEQTITRLAPLPLSEHKKIHFIHFNHTNPLLQDGSQHPVVEGLQKSGMKAGIQGQLILL